MSKVPPDFTRTLADVETLITRGEGATAAKVLTKLPVTKIPRRYAAGVASAMRRAGLPEMGVRLLHPIVRNKALNDATPEEKTTYGACLLKIGAFTEADAVLHGIDVKRHPDALLFQAHALVARWDYESSIAPLESYIAHTDLSDTQRMLGRLNLAAALVHECHYKQALPLLQDLMNENRKEERQNFLGNTLELFAQYAVGTQQWELAHHYLKKGESLIGKAGTLDSFFIHKWRALAHLLQKGLTPETEIGLENIVKDALKRQHFETVRDCEWYRAVTTGSRERILHVYFGTPFEPFRKRIFRDLKSPIDLPKTYDWFPRNVASSQIVEELVSPKHLKGPLLLLLRALALDFYRPQRVATLWQYIYPEEFYNPETSPDRVHQNLSLLKKWIKRRGFSLVIEQDNGYRFSVKSKAGIRLSRFR